MLNVKELFKFAILLEENGVAFYRHALRVTADTDAKVIFEYLANEELQHQHHFESMLNQSRDLALEIPDGDVSQLLRSTLAKVILTPEAFAAELAAVQSLTAALRFGQQRESEALRYYGELKKFLPGPLHRTLDTIIQEEGRHYAKLTDLLQNA
jgi:erythrin-vacuolar iron transport family protein